VGGKISNRVVLDFVKTHIGGQAGNGADEQGVAIGFGIGHVFRGDGATTSGSIVHHHRLSPFFTQTLTNAARQAVNAASRSRRHDQADGFIGIIFSLGQAQGNKQPRE